MIEVGTSGRPFELQIRLFGWGTNCKFAPAYEIELQIRAGSELQKQL